MAGHTPGPWKIWNGQGSMPRIIATKDGSSVADANAGFPCSEEEQDANAHLVAAAPELFEYALLEAEYSYLSNRLDPEYSHERFMAWVYKHGMTGPVGAWLKQKRDAAIAKAEGTP